MPADVHKIAEETARDFSETLMQTRQPKHNVLWEYIMASKITKLAAAAVIIIAVDFWRLVFCRRQHVGCISRCPAEG